MEKTLQQLLNEQILSDCRNNNGVKDSSECYLHVNGELYKQASDFETKEEIQEAHPEWKLITRKQPEGFTRVYYKA
jgi:hypothetical protein